MLINPLFLLECRKWGYEMGVLANRRTFEEKAYSAFPGFSGALWTLRKRAKSRFPGRAGRHPLIPHLLHPHLRQLNPWENEQKIDEVNLCEEGVPIRWLSIRHKPSLTIYPILPLRACLLLSALMQASFAQVHLPVRPPLSLARPLQIRKVLLTCHGISFSSWVSQIS